MDKKERVKHKPEFLLISNGVIRPWNIKVSDLLRFKESFAPDHPYHKRNLHRWVNLYLLMVLGID